jgi:hypothetical protein
MKYKLYGKFEDKTAIIIDQRDQMHVLKPPAYRKPTKITKEEYVDIVYVQNDAGRIFPTSREARFFTLDEIRQTIKKIG